MSALQHTLRAMAAGWLALVLAPMDGASAQHLSTGPVVAPLATLASGSAPKNSYAGHNRRNNRLVSNNCVAQNYVDLDFEFYRNGFKPETDEAERFKFFPGTGYFVGDANIESLVESESASDGYFFLWANRCHNIKGSRCGANPKGNLPQVKIGGKKRRFFFSTHQKANICTLAQAQNLLGVPQRTTRAMAERNKLRVAYNKPQLQRYFANHRKFHDMCYIFGEDISDNIEGIVLDYEVQDKRSPAVTRKFIERLAGFVRGRDKKIKVWTNPVGGTGWYRNGFSAGNIRPIIDSVDMMSILYHSEIGGPVRRELQKQLDMLNIGSSVQNRDKVYVIAGLGGMSLRESRQVRQFVMQQDLNGIAIWNNGARFNRSSCGSPAYTNVRCMAFGECR